MMALRSQRSPEDAIVKAAATCSLLLGLGFGLPGFFGTLHFAPTGQIWTFTGLPAYGGGPFARSGLPTSAPLLAGHVLVCLAEVATRAMLLVNAPLRQPSAMRCRPSSSPS
jgi:hypothetical protein